MALVKLNNRGVRSVSTFGSISSLGTYTFIKKITASSSANVSFVNGSSDVVLDNTYKEYLFTFNNIHPSSDQKNFQVNFRDGGSDFDATKTTTVFLANHAENDSFAALAYNTELDLAQSTSYQPLTENTGADSDQGCTGIMHLYDPSSTTFVKHFIAHIHSCRHADAAELYTTAGYCNVTAAIDAVDFKFSSGNIDAGDICLYGIN